MTDPYGVDQAADCDDPALLLALLVERYGDLRDLERERFTLVPVRSKQHHHRPPAADVTPEQGDVNLFTLTLDLERRDRQIRGDAA